MTRLRIGTRGSLLAMTQTGHVAAALQRAHPGLAFETIVIRTTGDEIADRPLSEIGGKGLFVKEIEAALLEDRIDLAVHSLKDVPADLPAGLVLAATPVREDPRDALIASAASSFAELPIGARVGTSSERRVRQLRAARPDLRFLPMRGNVDTRLGKLRAGMVEAIVLASAGLRRLGQSEVVTETLPTTLCLPAIGQGILALETRANDVATRELVGSLHDGATGRAAAAERATLRRLGGDCNTPIAVHATEEAGVLTVRAFVAEVAGDRTLSDCVTGPVDGDAAAGNLGSDLADALLARGAAALLIR